MPGSVLITIGGPTVCGFALSRTIIGECELMLLAVLPEYRGQGYGQTLLDAVIANALNATATAIFLEAREGNPAISLYSKAGFIEVGRRRSYYRGSCGEIFDAVTMRLAMS